MSSTANMMRRMPSVFGGASVGSARIALGVRNMSNSIRPWPSGGPQHCDVLSDVVDPDDTLHPTALDWALALQLHAKFDDERHDSVKVLDEDEDVVHLLDRHVGSPWCRTATVAPSPP